MVSVQYAPEQTFCFLLHFSFHSPNNGWSFERDAKAVWLHNHVTSFTWVCSFLHYHWAFMYSHIWKAKARPGKAALYVSVVLLIYWEGRLAVWETALHPEGYRDSKHVRPWGVVSQDGGPLWIDLQYAQQWHIVTTYNPDSKKKGGALCEM